MTICPNLLYLAHSLIRLCFKLSCKLHSKGLCCFLIVIFLFFFSFWIWFTVKFLTNLTYLYGLSQFWSKIVNLISSVLQIWLLGSFMLKCFCVNLEKRWRFEGLFMISHFNMCLILYRNMHNQNENRQGGEIVR